MGTPIKEIKRARWHQAEKWNPVIRGIVEDVRRSWPASALKVGGTWASPKILHHVDDLHPLFEWIAGQPGGPILREGFVAWALILEQNDGVANHRHVKAGERLPPNRLAGVYYVALPAHSGALVFSSIQGPSGHVAECFIEDAVEGESITFPADARHYVTRHQPVEPRISISWSAP